MFSILSLYGCTENNETEKKEQGAADGVNNENSNAGQYENMQILELGNEHMTIGLPATDPEASYPAYEIVIEEETEVEGARTAANELLEGDFVDVWLITKTSKTEIAEKIVVRK